MAPSLPQVLDREINLLHFENVLKVVNKGAAIDYVTKQGHTALSMAAWSGQWSVNEEGKKVLAVTLLLDRHTNRPKVNRVTPGGHSALTAAAANGRDAVIEQLLERGADLHQRYDLAVC